MHARTDRIGLGFTAIFFLSLVAAVAWPPRASGQTAPVMVEGQAQSMPVDEARAMSGSRRGRGSAQPAAAAPPQGEQPKPGPAAEAKPGATPSAEKKDEKANTIPRPEKPPSEPDPDELDVALNDQNLVPEFNFQGQPWPAVLAWYAKLSNCSLDWQELPNDYVNVFTLQPQPLDEVRNILNRLILARGFTMLQRDRVVSVFKVENIDPGLVEQIEELQLFSRKPYDFVKVAFKLPKAMAVDKAKDDLKQVLSPKARVLPFVSTHQVLVLDAVANLRTVSEMLNLERAKEEGKTPLKQFRLVHRRAEDVIDILYVTLGMDPKSKPSQQELQVRQQELQIMQQMAQRGTDVAKMLKPDGPAVFLTFNSQLNSIIANAPEEQMKMIEEMIKWLDIPLGGTPTEMPPGVAPLSTARILQTHKLRTLNPVTFKTTVDDIGDLSPFTVVQADQAGQSLVVQGTAADQEKIAKLITELDGEERMMKSIPLRRYPADEAAVSIRELIFGKSEKKDDSQQDPYYQYLMSMANRNQPQKEDPHAGFYVSADVVNNRLLVKANKKEFEQIYSLLKELGEVPDDRRDGMAMRVMEPTGADLLEQIRKAWGETGGNPLVINGPAKPPEAAKSEKEDASKKATQPANDRGVLNAPAMNTPAVFARFAAAQAGGEPSNTPAPDTVPTIEKPAAAPAVATETKPATAAEDAEINQAEKPVTEQPAAKAPVAISVTEDGRWVISSQDPEAVQRLEALIAELSPPPQRIKRFPLVHTTAPNMLWNLEQMYSAELKEDGQMIRDWYGRYQPTGPVNGSGLAKKPKLSISDDWATNSILVANATNAQLYEIGKLIKELDQPMPEAVNVRARVTAPIKVRYSRASIIATALKEVYVDLLSSRDKEFASGEEGRSMTSGSRKLTEIRFGDPANGGTKGPRLPLTFNGQLSVGADDVSNTLLISCDEELFTGVVDMIRKLDEESAPKMSIVVHAVEGTVAAESLQKTVNDSMGKPWLGGRPEDQAMRGGGQPQRGENPQGNNQPQPNRGRRSGASSSAR